MISVPFGQYAGCKARRTLHEQLLQSIVQKSIYFFQTTPFGRMMNRFSSDMAVIDKVKFIITKKEKKKNICSPPHHTIGRRTDFFCGGFPCSTLYKIY